MAKITRAEKRAVVKATKATKAADAQALAPKPMTGRKADGTGTGKFL